MFRGNHSPRYTSVSVKPFDRSLTLTPSSSRSLRSRPRRSVWTRVCGTGVMWLLLVAIGAAQSETLDRILAVVAGHVIMQSDVRAFVDLRLVDISPRTDDAVLAYLIERRLVLDEVDRYVVANPPSTLVEQRFQKVAGGFRSETDFRAALARVGFTDEDLRQVLRDDARRAAYIDNRFGAVAGTTDRDSLVTEWVAGLVRRGQVIRTPSERP